MLKEEELRKRMRTARREKALKALLHTYDLRGAEPEEAMRVAEMLDDIGTRSASPVHLLYVPKQSPIREIKSTLHTETTGSLLASTKTINLKNDTNFLETLKKRFTSRIEKMKDKIETCTEDIEFMKQQTVACLERTASHNMAPRAQDSEAVVILPVTGAHNCSILNQRMLDRSCEILKRRTMTKRAEVNDAVGDNMTIKYDIDNLRRERTTFQKILSEMRTEVDALKDQVKKDEQEMDDTQRERDELSSEYKQAMNEWNEKLVEFDEEAEKITKAEQEQERLEKLAREAEEKAKRQERNRKREEAKAQRAREREAQAITVEHRNKSVDSGPSPVSSPHATSKKEDPMQNSGGATQMQPDVMQEMTTELSEKWQQILIDSNLAKLRTEMSEEDLRDHVVDLLAKDDDNRFRVNKEMQNEKNRIGILEKEVRKLTKELKKMEENKMSGDSADAGTKALADTLRVQVNKLEKTVHDGIHAFRERKDQMLLLSDQVNTCYLRAGGSAMEDSDGPGASPVKAASTAEGDSKENEKSAAADDYENVIERLRPSDFKVLSQLGFLENHLKETVHAYAIKALDPDSASQGESLIASSLDNRRRSSVSYKRACVQERLGEMTISKPLRSHGDRIPRVDIPEDMDIAIGIEAEEQLNDTPFLRTEIEQRYESNLARVKGPSHSSHQSMQDSTNSISSGAGQSMGIIDAKEQLRREQSDLLRRVANAAIAEQSSNTRMRKRLKEEQNRKESEDDYGDDEFEGEERKTQFKSGPKGLLLLSTEAL